MRRARDAKGPHRGLFDLWSFVYDAPFLQWLVYRPEHDAMVRALRACGARRILDVGCGTGLLAARVRRGIGGGVIVDCDFSRGMLVHAMRRHDAPALVQATALRLPFREASFGAIVSTEALHWFPDQAAALKEFRRVVTPKGRILLTLVNPSVEWLSSAASAISRAFGEPFCWPTRVRMRAQVRGAGFRVAGQRYVFRLPLPLAFPTFLTEAESAPELALRAEAGEGNPRSKDQSWR
jgi:ubiquinone/menaquinone biosynthesis C-methylase UbiE